MIDRKLSIKTHLGYIRRKFNYINFKLMPVKLKKHEKFNLNCFDIFVEPLFRLLFAFNGFLNNSEKKLIEK